MRVIWFDGPVPPMGQRWCAVCAMLAKQQVIEASAELVRDAARRGADGPPLRLDMTAGLAGSELKAAVTTAISTLGPGYGVLDVCWSHCQAVTVSGSGIAPASPGQAAMFGGAVPLNGPRLPGRRAEVVRGGRDAAG